jgi:uncharacterized protein RhaS with RHS repeats
MSLESVLHFNARYYDPTTGRFLTEDPSRKGVNWYAYCENDPINRTDPTGKQSLDYAPKSSPLAVPNPFAPPISKEVATGLASAIEQGLQRAVGFIAGVAKVVTTLAFEHRDDRPISQQPNREPPRVGPPINLGDPGNLEGPNPPKFTGPQKAAAAALLGALGAAAYLYNRYFSEVGSPPAPAAGPKPTGEPTFSRDIYHE